MLPLLLLGLFSFTVLDNRYFEIARNLDIFASLYKEVNQYYVDDTNPNQLLKKGVDAMLKKLDPYTVYIPEDDIEDYRTLATGEYGGIGIQSNKINGKHVVLLVYEESPAFKSGLKIADEIVSIDGISIIDKSDEEAGKILKGQSGTKVTLGIKRANEENTLSLTMNREKITIPNVSYQGMLTPEIGYLRLSEFTRDAGVDVANAVKDLKDEGAQNIVLDLRGNPGGLLNEAVNICNIFIPKGANVVQTKGKTEAQSFTYDTPKEPLDLTIPLAVIINSGSASASEIVSGVIQDYDRGVIVGQKSYGKGLVQMSRQLSYNAQLKVTTAKYYIPSGRCIQALDYSNRRPDGSVGKIADSLKSEFKTSRGRIVYDGGGVDPDILVDATNYSAFSKNLAQSTLLFDYATKYFYEHDDIVDAKNFILTDTEYEDFLIWMRTKEFANNSAVESTLKALKLATKEDKVYKDLENELTELQNGVTKIKSNGLITFKDEIKRMLEEEIVKRYYLTKGKVEYALEHDAEINAAIEILKNKDQYFKLLKG